MKEGIVMERSKRVEMTRFIADQIIMQQKFACFSSSKMSTIQYNISRNILFHAYIQATILPLIKGN